MKVVLDTNVLISGIFFKGIPHQTVQAWLSQKFSVYASPLILEEYLRVISELSVFRKPVFEYNWSEILTEICEIIPDVKAAKNLCRDSSDDKFLLCAVHSASDYLVTGDLDLKDPSLVFDFKIISPRQFWEFLISRK